MSIINFGKLIGKIKEHIQTFRIKRILKTGFKLTEMTEEEMKHSRMNRMLSVITRPVLDVQYQDQQPTKEQIDYLKENYEFIKACEINFEDLCRKAILEDSGDYYNLSMNLAMAVDIYMDFFGENPYGIDQFSGRFQALLIRGKTVIEEIKALKLTKSKI